MDRNLMVGHTIPPLQVWFKGERWLFPLLVVPKMKGIEAELLLLLAGRITGL